MPKPGEHKTVQSRILKYAEENRELDLKLIDFEVIDNH